jgi:hypothetical protein
MIVVFEKVKEDGIEKKKYLVNILNTDYDQKFFDRLCRSLGKDPRVCEAYQCPPMRNDQSFRFDDDCNLIIIDPEVETVVTDELEDYEEPQGKGKEPVVKQRKVLKDIKVSKPQPPRELKKVF